MLLLGPKVGLQLAWQTKKNNRCLLLTSAALLLCAVTSVLQRVGAHAGRAERESREKAQAQHRHERRMLEKRLTQLFPAEDDADVAADGPAIEEAATDTGYECACLTHDRTCACTIQPLLTDLDHTADVQLHAWAPSLADTFGQLALAMCNYMTPIAGLTSDAEEEQYVQHAGIRIPKWILVARILIAHNQSHSTIAVRGQDLHTLVFNFLDEVLFLFHTEAFVTTNVCVTELDTNQWSLKATAYVFVRVDI